MRALRVVGLGIDGRTVILETIAARSGERRERFTLPADESLHAAVRGDLPRLGQIEIELESQMRPREIQARIRAGASVDQVASAAGVPAQRIERFAYPVLLERSRTAELARRAHPVRVDGPDVRTLEDVVADTFGGRGHDYDAVTWDSWRGENGKWVVQLRWRAGRSENRAHWTFHPGAHGGTVTSLDEHAGDLIDPQAVPLRTVRPVTELAGQPQDGEYDEPGGPEVAEVREYEPEETPAALAVPDDRVGSWSPRTPETPRQPEPSRQPDRSHERERPVTPPVEQPAAPAAPVPAPAASAAQPEPAAAAPKRGRKKPTMPSWEDVLLGVRSPRD